MKWSKRRKVGKPHNLTMPIQAFTESRKSEKCGPTGSAESEDGGIAIVPKFSAQHYNAIAKDIREELSRHVTQASPPDARDLRAVSALVDLALRLARRFVEDNPQFDPIKFLDACSPDVELYPLSELWEE